MKKYYHNKNFVPYSFVEKQTNVITSGDKRGLSLLVILALILFPIAIDKLTTKKEEPKVRVEVKEDGIDRKEIINWYDIMENNTDGVINNQGCILNVYDIESLNKICEKEEFSINTIQNLGENKYKLSVIKEK